MKLGLSIGYSGAHLEVPVALVQRAEELGYDSVWSAEAYGSDAMKQSWPDPSANRANAAARGGAMAETSEDRHDR